MTWLIHKVCSILCLKLLPNKPIYGKVSARTKYTSSGAWSVSTSNYLPIRYYHQHYRASIHPNISLSVAQYKLSVSLRCFEKYSTGCQLLPCYYSKMVPTASFEGIRLHSDRQIWVINLKDLVPKLT